MSTFTIKGFRPGPVLDGHVHDVLGFPEPVWPYSTHPKAQIRLREWLKGNKSRVRLPGEARASDDCVVQVGGFRESFTAANENHALCLAVLLSDYLVKYGRHIPVKGRW